VLESPRSDSVDIFLTITELGTGRDTTSNIHLADIQVRLFDFKHVQLVHRMRTLLAVLHFDRETVHIEFSR
jgi:Sec7-like guanine-nucleotide exchange factor